VKAGVALVPAAGADGGGLVGCSSLLAGAIVQDELAHACPVRSSAERMSCVKIECSGAPIRGWRPPCSGSGCRMVKTFTRVIKQLPHRMSTALMESSGDQREPGGGNHLCPK
jgi:hypothetical protein